MIQFSLSAMEQDSELSAENVDSDSDVLNQAMRLSGLRNDQAQLIERTRAQILGRPSE
jgi:hypothetical protein